jgi:hypothetical protein
MEIRPIRTDKHHRAALSRNREALGGIEWDSLQTVPNNFRDQRVLEMGPREGHYP